jgi:hypothetical protein
MMVFLTGQLMRGLVDDPHVAKLLMGLHGLVKILTLPNFVWVCVGWSMILMLPNFAVGWSMILTCKLLHGVGWSMILACCILAVGWLMIFMRKNFTMGW